MDQAGQPFEPPMKGFSPGRGNRPVARTARRMLRKPVEASKERASPADAFYPEAPCPRPTTQAFRKCKLRNRYEAPGRADGLPYGNKSDFLTYRNEDTRTGARNLCLFRVFP